MTDWSAVRHRLENALDAMGCPHPRSQAALTVEVLPEILEECGVTTGVHLTAVRGERDVLQEASHLVNGERQEDYGDPVECMGKWAEILKLLYGWDIDAHKASVAMSLLKHVREANRPKRDNRVDAPAYMHIADLAYERLFGE